MASNKRTVRVFFSSPFRGMEREREMLSAVYWPKISHSCADKGLTFVPIDFRWGITEESSMAASTVSICLDQVRDSDIFIGFFGARYGWHGLHEKNLQASIQKAIQDHPWLEDYRDRSVTEFEFLEGRLRHERSERPAAMFFRNSHYDNEMFERLKTSDPAEAKVFTSEYDGQTAKKLLYNLKLEVRNFAEKLPESSAYFFTKDYDTPEEGAKLMFDAVMEILEDQFLKSDQMRNFTKLDYWIEAQKAYIDTGHSIGDIFLGRETETGTRRVN